MVSSAIAATDPLAAKIHVIADWSIMLSGTLGEADIFVDSLTREMLQGADNEPSTIRKYLEKVHREELAIWSAGRWLSPFGLNMDGFLQRGNALPPSVESDISRNIAINAENYDVEVIVCGWGETIKRLATEKTSKPQSYIFSVDYSGVKLHKTAGLYACGSGASAALSTLYFHNYGPGCPLPRAIYLVATAKFMAEKTLGVGPNTVMFAMKRTGGWIPIMPDHLKTIL